MCKRNHQHSGELAAEHEIHCAGSFPFWTLWLIFPALCILKGASLIAAPLLAGLNTPLVGGITVLPLLLIAIGAALLLLNRSGRG